ncbi:HAD family hydrolase [Rhizobium tubonense]|uniref:HAD family hydrolase n=1 Tax=Rhizobium tubonense TaxID=484088 RepID=A0A2W4CJV4_9HYPH|nr:HAD family hydrolase [Rhizobium tubonense]PZM12971.1 hypothetical protein CPY51_15700 [Rhizobium tubonense]
MPFELLICDCDGVLVDSEVLACRVDAEELADRGFSDYTLNEVLRRFAGVSQTDMIRAIELETGRSVGSDFATRVTQRVEEALAADLLPLPYAAATLESLGVRKCVASSSSPKKLELALSVTGLKQYFHPSIYSSVLVEHGKPAPDLFLHAAADMGVSADRCCVVEDSAAGVKAGIAAGMIVIGFTGGAHCLAGHAERLAELGAHAVVNSWTDIPRLIEELGNTSLRRRTVHNS